MSATPIHTADTEGTRAVYAFADITKLRMDQKPPAAAGGPGAMAMPGAAAPEDLLFRFAKTPAGTSRVTVVFPEAKVDQARKAAQAQQPAGRGGTRCRRRRWRWRSRCSTA